MSDLTSPIAKIPIDRIFSCIIINNRLYLGGKRKVYVFEETTSRIQPLTLVKIITTEENV